MFLVCFLTVANKRSIEQQQPSEPLPSPAAPCTNNNSSSGLSLAVSNMTLFILAMSCLSVLRVALQFHRIHAIGSNLVWKIALTYLCFTFVLFALVAWSLEGPDTNRLQVKLFLTILKACLHFYTLQDCWFLVPLFTDMSKVTRMAQFALSSSHYRRVSEKVIKQKKHLNGAS